MKDLRVLIVEDEGPLASLLSQAFDNEGAVVSLASDGLDCMSKVADFKPHVIVMDIMMPRLDGIDTTRLIRRREGFGQVVIIALSAAATWTRRKACWPRERICTWRSPS